MTSTKVKFVRYAGEVPILGISLASGETLCTIVDSGSEPNVVNKKFFSKHKDQFNENADNIGNFIGMEGPASHLFKTVSGKISLCEGHKITTEFSVLDISEVSKHMESSYGVKVDMILGSEFLRSINARLDYKKQEMSFNDLSSK